MHRCRIALRSIHDAATHEMSAAARAAALAILLATATPPALRAQAPVTRRAAIDSALRHGPGVDTARATLAASRAALLTARARPNPIVSPEWSGARPRMHVTLELPLDLPGVRGARQGGAAAALRAAEYRFRFDSAGIAFAADSTYTIALAARARARLSRRNAADADSLRRMARRRADAGDAAEMDVLLATVNAGREANAALADSLDEIARLLDLQAVMGLDARDPMIVLADSLALTDSLVAARGDTVARDSAPTLPVAAAVADVRAAALGLRVARRGRWGQPGVVVGGEWQGAADEPGFLPIVGVALPLPLFDRGRGVVAQANAEEARAVAALAAARIGAQSELAHTRRERDVALARVARDRLLLADAERVAAMSLTAYREGAAALPAVLEARRTVREVTSQYVDDVAAALVAAAELRHLEMRP